MRLLIFRPSFEAIREALAARPDVEPLIVELDGSVVRVDGTAVTDVDAEAAWLSTTFFTTPDAPFRAYLGAIHASPSMQWVQSGAAGHEHPLFQGILDAGIRLSISDGNSLAIAEYVLAQVLACFHPGAERLRAQQAHAWTRLPFREIAGTRWVILGYGSIGRHVAERARAFGAEIVGIRRTPRPDPHASRVVGLDALVEEVSSADVLVVCAAANDDNRHIIDADLLASMKADALLVNVGRGSLLDEAALIAALDAGRPGQAVLDVTETEPLPEDDPLWDHPRIRITAHCSAASPGTAPRGDVVFLEHLDAFRAGEPLRLEITSAN